MTPSLKAQAELLLRDIPEEELRTLRPAELCGLYCWGDLKAKATTNPEEVQAWARYTRKVFLIWAERINGWRN